MNIDGELEDTKGIKEANTNYVKATTEVQPNPKAVKPEDIINESKNRAYGKKRVKQAIFYTP